MTATPAIRIAVSAVVLIALLAFVPIGALLEAIAQVSPRVWTSALLVFISCHVAAAYKWRLLMGGRAGLPLIVAIRSHFAGLVSNLCLPGVVGGDLVRAGLAIRQSQSGAAVTLASVVDRLIDTVSLAVLAAGGIVWVGARSPGVRPVLATAVVMMFALAAGLGALCWGLRRYRANPRIAQGFEALALLGRRPHAMAAALTVSLMSQGALVMLNAYLGSAVGVECHLGAWLVAWPMAKLAALVPVSAGGIGVREAALIAFLQPFGASASRTLASGLLWEAILVAGALLGWLVTRALPSRPAPAHHATEALGASPAAPVTTAPVS